MATTRNDTINNYELRQRALYLVDEAGWTWSDIAIACGRVRKSGQAETSWVKRRLGISPDADGKLATVCSYDVAVILCRAMMLDPHEVGV